MYKKFKFLESNVNPLLIKQIGSPYASTSSCTSPDLATPFKGSPLETTPRPFKRKLLEETASPVSTPSEAITEHCIQILNSAKRRRENMLELLSPIIDLPRQSETKSSIILSDLFGESDEEPVIANVEKPNARFQYILKKTSPRSPSDWCKNPDKTADPQNIPLETASNGEIMEYGLESPASPMMPYSSEGENFDPVMIPIDRPKSKTKERYQPVIRTLPKTSFSALRVVINEYDYKKRLKVVKNTFQKIQDSHRISYDIEVLRILINQYLKEHWSRDAAQLIFQKCMKFKMDVVITAILETIEDNSDDPVSMENTPPAPALPLTHQKLIMVVELLDSCMKKKLLHALDRKIFTLKIGKDSENVQTLMSLAHFYIGLTDIEKNVSAARLFIYKSLYYYNHKSFPLVYAMITAHPNCLSKTTNSAYNKDDDALLTTIKTILMNCPKDTFERSEFKKRELRSLLLTEYSYRPFDPSTDAVVNILIDRLKQNQLKNLDHSFILLAKRYGFEWAMSKIVKIHLYPLLEQLIAQSIKSDINDLQIVYCLRILSTILKTCPSNVDKTYFLQLFKTILDKSTKPMIQEAAVEALLRFQRFGFVDVYQRIKKWNPHHKITPKLLLMLKTFVYRKDLTFWNALE